MKTMFFLLLLPVRLLAQNLSGVWTGTLYNDTTKQYISYELAISDDDGKLTGYSHTVFLIDSVENIGLKIVKIKKAGDTYRVEDEKLIYNNYTAPPAKGIRMFSQLSLSGNDSSLRLQGPWTTNVTRKYKKLTGYVFLKKKKDINDDRIIPKLENLGLANTLSFVAKEKHIGQPDKSTINVPTTTNKASPTENNLTFVKKQEKDSDKNVETVGESNIKTGVDSNNKRDVNKTSQLPKAFQIPERKMTDSSGIVAYARQRKTDDQSSSLKKGINTYRPDDISKTSDSSSSNTNLQPKPEALNKIAINPNSEKLISDKGDHQTKKDQQVIQNHSFENINNESKRFGSKSSNENAPIAASNISERKIETIKTVEIKADSLILTLYDNGVVDGDTVSVLLNGKVIMPMEGLSLKPITKTIYLTPEMGDSIKLVMYAENLGSIPPNTGLLIVQDGDHVNYINFSGDLHQNAAIILKRKHKL